MKAIEITDIKAENNLQLIDTDIPKPASGQILIKVSYASVNRPDLLQRKGMQPVPKGASPFPGLDVSGIVQELGEDCAEYNLNIGDEVCALLSGGGYAEYALADAALCLPKPSSLSLKEAAALPECVYTVWNNLFLRGHLTKGDTVLIHGGSSGIGSFAIQMAKAAGSKVITTAGNDDKCNFCNDLGADIAINYKTNDFEEYIINAIGKQKINVVLDMVGGDYLSKNINLLAAEGRHINIAFLNGKDAYVDISKIMQKRLTLTGSTLRTRPLEEKAAIARGLKKHIWPWIEEGKIKPHIHAEFPLAEALEAHEIMKKSQHTGKIILAI